LFWQNSRKEVPSATSKVWPVFRKVILGMWMLLRRRVARVAV
jgi:hypothetical protein